MARSAFLFAVIATFAVVSVFGKHDCPSNAQPCQIGGRCCDPNKGESCYTSSAGNSACMQNKLGSLPSGTKKSGADPNSHMLKNLRAGTISITGIRRAPTTGNNFSALCGGGVSDFNVTITQVANALKGLIVNATVISGTSLVQSEAISKFLKPGNSMSVLLMAPTREGSIHLTKIASAVMANGANLDQMLALTSLQFCPITNNNVLEMTVRLNGFSLPTGQFIDLNDTNRVATLAKLSGAELTITLAKVETLIARNVPVHWAVALKSKA